MVPTVWSRTSRPLRPFYSLVRSSRSFPEGEAPMSARERALSFSLRAMRARARRFLEARGGAALSGRVDGNRLCETASQHGDGIEISTLPVGTSPQTPAGAPLSERVRSSGCQGEGGQGRNAKHRRRRRRRRRECAARYRGGRTIRERAGLPRARRNESNQNQRSYDVAYAGTTREPSVDANHEEEYCKHARVRTIAGSAYIPLCMA